MLNESIDDIKEECDPNKLDQPLYVACSTRARNLMIYNVEFKLNNLEKKC